MIDSHSTPVSDQAAFTALCQEWRAAVVQDALAVSQLEATIKMAC